MLSNSLLKQSLKSNWVILGAMTALMGIFVAQFSAMEMVQNLLFTLFYGMLGSILPGIYILITANKLLAGQIDRGSMAYILSAPIRRSKVVLTQVFFMAGTLGLMYGVTAVIHILINQTTPWKLAFLSPELTGNLTVPMILKLNLAGFVMMLALAGVCFMFSGIFNLSKYSIGFSGTFLGAAILGNMFGMFGDLGVDGLSNFKYISVFSLFNYNDILLGGSEWILGVAVAAVIAIVSFAIGSAVFCKKDLPL